MVQTVPAEDFSRVYSPNVTQTLDQRIPGVFTSDAQGNEFTSDLRYRGFTASPLQGTPQGLAVYMQGVRVNEAFGDTVNWDLIPTVAIGRADVWTNNPAFGLNALGGAISFQMKDGFTYRGTEFDASGGSFGRLGGWLQYGVRNGEWAAYLAAQDCVLIATDHSAYDYDFIVQHATFVLDTRNATKNVKVGRYKIRKA